MQLHTAYTAVVDRDGEWSFRVEPHLDAKYLSVWRSERRGQAALRHLAARRGAGEAV